MSEHQRGTAPSTSNGSTGIEAGSGSSPRAPKPRRRLLIGPIIGAAAVMLLVIAGVAVVAALNGHRTAAAVAQEYFEALAAGDADTAKALVETTDSGDRTDLLTDDILGTATELITDVDVRPADDPLDTFDQTVIVTYTLAGEQHTDEVVVRRGESEWGVLRTWQMPASIVPEATILTDGERPFTIAGADIDSGTTVWIFPAVYPVAAAQSEYFELEQDTLEIGDPQGSFTRLGIGYTPALVDEAQEQVNTLLDECAATETNSWSDAADASPSACPLRVVVPDAGGTAEGTWEILEYPVIELRDGASLLTTSGGRAAFTPEGSSTRVEMARGIELLGTIDITETGPIVTLSDNS